MNVKSLHTLSAVLAFSLIAVSAKADNYVVPGTSDPYLSGMPDGSSASLGDGVGDYAPGQSPVLASGLSVAGGDTYTWSATGTVGYGPDVSEDGGPNGISDYFTSHGSGAQNGISDITVNVDALVGVFLGPLEPDLSSAPGPLDFSVSGAEAYTTLDPELQQLFFLGAGGTGQTVVAPAGSTRLFLGMMDGFGWDNNTGAFDVTIQNTTSTVPDSAELCWLAPMAVVAASALLRRRRLVA
jgi:MYXO-CTERM domain-containing protein